MKLLRPQTLVIVALSYATLAFGIRFWPAKRIILPAETTQWVTRESGWYTMGQGSHLRLQFNHYFNAFAVNETLAIPYRAWVSRFEAMSEPVTAVDVLACINAGACTISAADKSDHHLYRYGYTFALARDFCAWQGAALPTHAQLSALDAMPTRVNQPAEWVSDAFDLATVGARSDAFLSRCVGEDDVHYSFEDRNGTYYAGFDWDTLLARWPNGVVDPVVKAQGYAIAPIAVYDGSVNLEANVANFRCVRNGLAVAPSKNVEVPGRSNDCQKPFAEPGFAKPKAGGLTRLQFNRKLVGG